MGQRGMDPSCGREVSLLVQAAIDEDASVVVAQEESGAGDVAGGTEEGYGGVVWHGGHVSFPV